MTYVNVNLVLPPYVEAGIAAGKFYRDAGVIRDVATKQIVKHLKEVNGQKSADSVVKAVASIKANPTVAVSIAVTGVGIAAAVTVVSLQKRSSKTIVRRFESALQDYFRETQAGANSIAVIDELDSALSATKTLPASLSNAVLTSPTVLGATKAIAEYTRTLARMNGLDLPGHLTTDFRTLDLSEYLAVQRRIVADDGFSTVS
jgi:hypothetical protein